MLLSRVVATSASVAATRSRTQKTALLADLLRDTDPADVGVVASYLSGVLRQRRTGLGWRTVAEVASEPAGEVTLTAAEVDAAFAALEGLAGPGSQQARREACSRRWRRPRTSRSAPSAGRRCSPGRRSVEAAVAGGAEALEAVRLEVGRPLRPMLAGSAKNLAEGLDQLARQGATPYAVDAKLDGIRVQVHRDGDQVRVFTRSLDDITERVEGVVESVRSLPAERLVLDGEALLTGPDGRPRPFQETASRSSTRAGTPEAAGHEGVVLKNPATPYEAGRRGSGWIKVKPRHTLDLVVLAVEWGSGRRQGLLSNIYLGARADDGSLLMLGKTFKGMTDAVLAWQTERFLELETHREGHVVHVRPEQVVEIAFDGVQRSTRYPGGVALRFARVVRYRDDKAPAEADTVGAVRALVRT